MPKVTQIKAQQKRKHRYSIYIDGQYRFSLTREQLVDAGLRVGDDLADEKVAQLVNSSELGKALDRACNFLSYRLRSRGELLIYLRRRDYDEATVDAVVAELERRGLIDDARFAEQWIDDRQLLSPRSRRQLQAELRLKQIDPAIIEAALASIDHNSEVQTIISLIEKKQLRRRYQDRRKLIAYLAGVGYPINAINAALDQIEQDSAIDLADN